MDKKPSLADILELDVHERIELVGDIWDSIASVPEAVSLTDEQRDELDRRLASRDNPELGSPWEDVRKRLSKRG